MISFISGVLFDFRTIAVLFVLVVASGTFFSVRIGIRDRAQAGVEKATKHARASQRAKAAGVAWPEPDQSGDRPSLIVEPRPSEFDGRVIFYSPNGPIDLTRFVRDVRLPADVPDTLGSVNDSTARGDHGEAPDRPEYEGDQDRPTNTRTTLYTYVGDDEPLRAGQAGAGKHGDRDPFDGADPIVFGRA